MIDKILRLGRIKFIAISVIFMLPVVFLIEKAINRLGYSLIENARGLLATSIVVYIIPAFIWRVFEYRRGR